MVWVNSMLAPFGNDSIRKRSAVRQIIARAPPLANLIKYEEIKGISSTLRKLQATDILDALKAMQAEGVAVASSSEILARVGGSYATVGRLLDRLVQENLVVRTGKARATRYFLAPGKARTTETANATDRVTATVSPRWSAKARSVISVLNRPLGVREPVTFKRRFVDGYAPNKSFLLPRELAETLAQEGRMTGQQPAGTYARKVIEQLLIDLSWSSSRLATGGKDL